MTEQEKKDIKEIFEELNESPLYNLSMCSLENFHTNFLVWLGKTYPQQTLELLVNCIADENVKNNLKSENIENIEFVTQESLGKDCKFDLCVKGKDNAEGEGKPKGKGKAKDSKILLVLENKIKSYPTEEQLEKYNKKFGEETVKILLTLFPFELPEENKTWNIIDYSKLSKNLKAISIDYTNLDKGDYHKNLIVDYCSMISNISKIVGEIKKDSFDKYDIYQIANNLKDFHDVYVKYRTADLKNKIEEEIKRDGIKINLDFSHKSGTINIEKNFDGFALYIQIQYNQYRYCLVWDKDKTPSKKEKEQKAENLSDLWFPEKSDGQNSDKFLNFGENFIYKYKKLYNIGSISDEDKNSIIKTKIKNRAPKEADKIARVGYCEIIEQVKSDIERLCTNQEAIQNAYNEFPTSDKT